MIENGGVPEEVRAEVAALHENVYPRVIEGLYSAAVPSALQILERLHPYPNANQVYAFAVEKAWSYFAIGMDARSRGRLGEAAAALRNTVEMLPALPQTGSLPFEARNQLALLHAERGDYGSAAAVYRQLLQALQQDGVPIPQGVFWLAYGRVMERLGGRDDRVEAIHAYSCAIRRQPADGPPAGWTYEAYAGIVRCSFSQGPGEARPFWHPWLRGWCIYWFVPLVILALTLYGTALYHLTAYHFAEPDFAYFKWLLVMFAIPVVVILLPSLRKASGHGWSIEMQDAGGSLRFAFDLTDPAGYALQPPNQ